MLWHFCFRQIAKESRANNEANDVNGDDDECDNDDVGDDHDDDDDGVDDDNNHGEKSLLDNENKDIFIEMFQNTTIITHMHMAMDMDLDTDIHFHKPPKFFGNRKRLTDLEKGLRRQWLPVDLCAVITFKCEGSCHRPACCCCSQR